MFKELCGEIYTRLEEAGLSHVKRDEPMARHTTFRTGGNASLFVEVLDIYELKTTLALAGEYDAPYFILGNGSNVLVRDEGYDGIIIKLAEDFSCCGAVAEIKEKRFEKAKNADEAVIYASGQERLVVLAREALRAGFSGMEELSGIPGSIGGAVAMNAGAYGTEIKDIIESVDAMNKKGEVIHLLRDELDLSYRHSRIQSEEMIVLGASFRLKRAKQAEIEEKMKKYQAARREKQPLEYASAGSTFKRPEGYYAGKLIEDAGLKGYTVGGAQVSEKHCGFVINRDKASAADILQVIDDVTNTVRDKFGVVLEPEIKIL